MANIYGPMQFRPNPSGLTLNSSPVGGFQPPAAPQMPVGAPVAQQPTFLSWLSGLGSHLGGGMKQAFDSRDMSRARLQRDRHPEAMSSLGMFGMGQGGQGGGRPPAAPVQGPLSLDPTALAYMNFLNGRS